MKNTIYREVIVGIEGIFGGKVFNYMGKIYVKFLYVENICLRYITEGIVVS